MTPPVSSEKVRIPAATKDYEVRIGGGLLDRSGAVLVETVDPGPALVVTDANVGPLYLPAVQAALEGSGFTPEALTFEAGEGAKSLGNVRRIYDALLALGADRGTPVVALGGGVVSDLSGFAAATFLRGLPWLPVPTTLLAQVDASVGGKTAVNLPAGKNLAGAFHQPEAVLADLETLATLDPRHHRSGLAEVVKIALTLDPSLLSVLRGATVRFADPASNEIAGAVRACVAAKARVVESDEREAGPRRVLNFGHTAGHAIEAAAGYGGVLHGEAVAVGMMAAIRISVARGLLDSAREAGTARLLLDLGLPVGIEDLPVRPGREAIRRHLERDKKIRGGRLALVLLEAPGRPRTVSEVGVEEILDATS